MNLQATKGDTEAIIRVSGDGVTINGELQPELVQPIQETANFKTVNRTQVDTQRGSEVGDEYVDANVKQKINRIRDYLITEGFTVSATESLQSDGPFSDIPVIPDNLTTLTKPWLIRWLEWVKAGKPEISEAEALEFNPALHPRDPDTGKFVERPFNIPDSIDSASLSEQSTGELLQTLADEGEDVESVIQADNISIDGVSDDVSGVDELDADSEPAIVSTIREAESDEEAREIVADYVTENTSVEEVDFERFSKSQSETLLNTLDQYIQGDFEVDPFAEVDLMKDVSIGMGASWAAFDMSDSSLGFKPKSMDGPNDNLAEDRMVSNTPFGTVHHEMGHARQTAKLGEDIFDAWLWPPDFDEDDRDFVESEISTYAGSDPEEFVAEIHVKKQLGEEVPERLEELYNELGGPEVSE